MTDIGREDLQVVFDTAVHSLDFSSGFLDHAEVMVLRRIARLLNVDPDIATPDNFKGHIWDE
jgi:hypothetical protein